MEQRRLITVRPLSRQSPPPKPDPAFEVDDSISIKLKFDLAMRLADLILNSGSIDKQLIALGYSIRSKSETVEVEEQV